MKQDRKLSKTETLTYVMTWGVIMQGRQNFIKLKPREICFKENQKNSKNFLPYYLVTRR